MTMGYRVHLSRLLRKKPIDIHHGGSSSIALSKSQILLSATRQMANAPLIIGYFIAFPYSVLLAPSTVPAVVFVASITALLSELCKYELLTCRRNISYCSYGCSYQILGEFPAYLNGWIQFLNLTSFIALLARSLGTILQVSIGNRLALHHLITKTMANEDFIGLLAQLIVYIFVLFGLKVTKFIKTSIKMLSIATLVLFASVISDYLTRNDSIGGLNDSIKLPQDDFLQSAAIITLIFKPDNREPQLKSKSSLISAFLGGTYCANFILLMALAIISSFLPTNVLHFDYSSAPLLGILAKISEQQHCWFIVTFASFCIVIWSLSLVETVEDARRHLVKMASDGLVFKQFAVNSKWSILAICFVSILLEISVNTYTLVCVLAFAHLSLDACLGLVVAYRRYCLALPYSAPSTRKVKNKHSKLNEVDTFSRLPTNSDSSEDEDIDEIVDQYKTDVYVATVMEWNGMEMIGNESSLQSSRSAKTSYTVKILLGVLLIVMLIISWSMRWMANLNYLLISVCALCFAVYLLISSVIWLHPQKLRTSDTATFKVPCVPWICVLASLFHFILLFQLPSMTFAIAVGWITSGVLYYMVYGYRKSRLNFRGVAHFTAKPIVKKSTAEPRMRILPESFMNISSSSVTVYQQPYQHIL